MRRVLNVKVTWSVTVSRAGLCDWSARCMVFIVSSHLSSAYTVTERWMAAASGVQGNATGTEISHMWLRSDLLCSTSAHG